MDPILMHKLFLPTEKFAYHHRPEEKKQSQGDSAVMPLPSGSWSALKCHTRDLIFFRTLPDPSHFHRPFSASIDSSPVNGVVMNQRVLCPPPPTTNTSITHVSLQGNMYNPGFWISLLQQPERSRSLSTSSRIVWWAILSLHSTTDRSSLIFRKWSQKLFHP